MFEQNNAALREILDSGEPAMLVAVTLTGRTIFGVSGHVPADDWQGLANDLEVAQQTAAAHFLQEPAATRRCKVIQFPRRQIANAFA